MTAARRVMVRGDGVIPARVLTYAGFAAGTAVLLFLFHGLRHDDAFITFRFARNLALGNGFVFNPGTEPILGTTSPLSTLVLAALYPLIGDALPIVAVGLGAAALTAQALLLFRLGRDTLGPPAALAAILVWLGIAGGHEWLSLETNLVAALVLATLACLDARRDALAGVCLGLAYLTRSDAALLVPIVIGSELLRRRRLPILTLAVSAAVVAPWLVWATWTFGSFLPNTLGAKRGLSAPLPYVAHYIDLLLAQPWEAVGLPRRAGVITPILWLAGAVAMWRHRSSHLAELLVYALLLFGAYVVIGPPAGHHWHLYPVSLASAVLAIIGAASIAAGAVARLPIGQRVASRATGVLAVLVVLLAGMAAVRRASDFESAHWLGWRHDCYATIAEWLREHGRPDASLLTPEIGTIGYLSDLHMIDASGLINFTNDFPRTQTIRPYINLVRLYEPDFVLSHSQEEAEQIAAETRYRVVHRFSWGNPWSTLLARSADIVREPDGSKSLSGADR